MNQIQSLRKGTGLSQSKFAQTYEISLRTPQQWEQGISSPPEHTIKMLHRLICYEKRLNKTYSLEKYRLPPKDIFKVCIDDPFMNCERIYPIQQKKVKALIDDITEHSTPSKIIIFGSSVTEHCHIGSDIDIYTELPSDLNPIKRIHDFEYDFWSNYSVDTRLQNEIQKKGVLVYG